MHGTGGAPRQSRGTNSDMLGERTTEQLDGCAGVHNVQKDEVVHARHMQRREHVTMTSFYAVCGSVSKTIF